MISTGVVTTIGGTVTSGAGVSGSTDATGTSSLFKNPGGIAYSNVGGSTPTLYIADTLNHTIRSFVLSSGATATISGTAGSAQFVDGIGNAARLQGPVGIGITTSGSEIYVADSSNHAIRRVALASQPTVTTPFIAGPIGVGGNATFTIQVTGNPAPTITWERQPAGGSTFTSVPNSSPFTGVGTTSLTIGSSGTQAANNGDQYRAKVANGVGSDQTSTATALSVQEAPKITSASSASFSVGTTGNFTFTATGSPAPTWSVGSGSPGSINPTTGVYTYTASNNSGSPFTFIVQAGNGVSPVAQQTFVLTIQNGATISSQPTDAGTGVGGNAQFSVVASGTPNTFTYQWLRNPGGVGIFSQMSDIGGVYSGTNGPTLTVINAQQNMNGDLFQVVVGNGIGSTVTSNSVKLTIQQAPQITSLASATFQIGVLNTFQIQATGSPAPTFSVGSGFPGSLDSNTGVISYTPANDSGSPFTFIIQAANGVSPAAQQTFTLTVTPTGALPSFTTQPGNATIAIGAPATFTAVAAGTPTPTYQWQREPSTGGGFVNITDGGAYSGATTGTLSISAVNTGMNGDRYQVIASNTVNNNPASATSNIATLTVNVGTIISTIAGTVGTSATLDETGLKAQFTNPYAVATDSSVVGNVYVADPTAHVIRKITTAGVVTTIAGKVGIAGNLDGSVADARFNGPSGVAVDSGGTIYVADTNNHTIRVISLLNGVPSNVTTLAGTAGSIGSTDSANGSGSSARFNYPFGVAVDSFGTVYVADTFNNTIRKVTQTGGVTTIGGVAGSRGSANGVVPNSRFALPIGVAVDAQGSVYVADSGNNVIRRINQGGEASTYAGSVGNPGTTDGAALTAARFSSPNSVAVDSNGVVYVAEPTVHTIRRIALASFGVAGDVTTLAGSPGTSGSADGAGSAARFFQPNGIAVDSSGNVYVADSQNRTIRRSGAVTAASITTQPANTSVAPGGTATFTVAAVGSPAPTSFQWQRKPADGSTDFVNLTNDGTYSNVTTATLTITGVLASQNNDQFRVIVSNFISPEAVSNSATLSTVVASPVFTSAASATFKATQLGAFTVAATGNPTPTYSLSSQPSFLSINATTGVISGTPADTVGSPFTFTVTANNGVAVTQTFTLTVTPAIEAPAITVQPTGGTIARGQNANFSVTATGTDLTYQWSKDGVEITGATNSTLTLTGVQYANAGNYTVKVNNVLNTPVTSVSAPLFVLTPPTITTQPHSQVALTGSNVTFTVVATGIPAPTYKWRANGLDIGGQTNATLTLTNVQAINAANYDVIVSNGVGGVLSSLAQLTVQSAASAPVITASPAARTIVVGSQTVLSVGVSAAPAPTFQWRKGGVNILGATGPTYTLTNAQLGDSTNYDVVVTNSAGSVTSAPAAVTVVRRSYAGYYFGALGNNNGSFGLYVRADNSAVFLGYLTGSSVGVRSTDLTVSDTGSFSFLQGSVAVSGTIADSGAISGTVIGGGGSTLIGTRTNAFGSSLAASGYYQGAATNTSSVISAIVSPTGSGFVLVQATGAADGGSAAIDSANRVTVTGSRQTINATIDPATSTITATVASGSSSVSFFGATDTVIANQRLSNISTRARVGTGDNVAIAGFVVSGQESKPVLIRAIGPSLATFAVTGAVAQPKLELFRGNATTPFLTNTGWTTAGNTAAIVAATTQAGAFQLGATSADSVIFATLAPGSYTAVISSANATPGIALAEVYDLSAAAAGQKLFNISTRANTGLTDSILTAGISISGSVPKRLLIRGVGPTLTGFGVAGALAQPQITLIKDGTIVATASNWSVSPDAAAITAASAQVGAFTLGANSADAALIISLAPGNYSAQLTGANGTTGVAIIEVYELP